MCPKRRFLSHLSASRRDSKAPRLRPTVAGSPTHPAETGSSSYGLLFRLRLLPTPPRGDAVSFSYSWRNHHDAGTLTLLTTRPHGRTAAGILARRVAQGCGHHRLAVRGRRGRSRSWRVRVLAHHCGAALRCLRG